MLKNNLKTALRFLVKNKAYSVINIFGLAVGTLCCLYILLYVQDQYSYDSYHNNAAEIYRVTSTVKLDGDKRQGAATSPPVAPALKKDFDAVEDFTRVVNTGLIGVTQHLLRYREKLFYEKEAVFVDPGYFDVFTYHFSYGSPAKCLNDPYSIVLIKSVSDKLFGNTYPIGKMISIDNAYGQHDFKVTGVVDETLGKSHIQANMFISMNSGGIGDFIRNDQTWAGNNFVHSYIKLRQNVNVKTFEAKLPAFLEKYGQQQLKSVGMEKELHLQPVTAIHTSPGYEFEISKTVSPSFLMILVIIAIMIQVVACINFMNLSTARASKRAKEVGVRKVIGASKGDLIRHFLIESAIISVIGIVIAFPLLMSIMPVLNNITGANIGLSDLFSFRILILMTGLIVITGLLAGSYPAFYLSSFNAIKVIKGNYINHVSGTGIRRSLIVFQFVLSIVLITGIIVIYSQLHFIKDKDLGFDQRQKLILSFYTPEVNARIPSFMNDLRSIAEINAVSKANSYPSEVLFNDRSFYLSGGNAITAKHASFISADENFVAATGIKLIAGRNFIKQDSAKMLINERMVKELGLKTESAPGTRIFSPNSMGMGAVETFEIAGVIKDFNYNSLHETVKPFMIMYDPHGADLNNVIISANTNNYNQLLRDIQTVWARDLADVPFSYLFLDAQVQHQYETENTLSRIINSFTMMAIMISCLGLFGLAAFSAEQKSKEIGIRKVLGSSVVNIVTMMSSEFIKLIIVAFIIAVPVGWLSMHQWLEGFAYRISLSWWMFTLSGAIAIIIAMLTVSYQSIKAALVNPIKSLKSD